jgi:hypothetical protein
MTDYHVITPEAAELVMQATNGQLVIVPPATQGPINAAAPAQPNLVAMASADSL